MLKPNSQTTTNLIKARELIADEKNWCKWSVENRDGQRCAMGALNVVMNRNASHLSCKSIEWQSLTLAAVGAGYLSPVDVNNHDGHAATIRMFDRAIELSLQDA